MNNTDVEQILDECKQDLERIHLAITNTLGPTSPVVPFLTNYAVIRACGTMEVAFKSIITDHCSRRSKRQVKNYLENKVRNSSMNPSYSRIVKTLKDFDPTWQESFKNGINGHHNRDKILTSMESLVGARNAIAHGGQTQLSITDIVTYFDDFREAIEILDSVVS